MCTRPSPLHSPRGLLVADMATSACPPPSAGQMVMQPLPSHLEQVLALAHWRHCLERESLVLKHSLRPQSLAHRQQCDERTTIRMKELPPAPARRRPARLGPSAGTCGRRAGPSAAPGRAGSPCRAPPGPSRPRRSPSCGAGSRRTSPAATRRLRAAAPGSSAARRSARAPRSWPPPPWDLGKLLGERGVTHTYPILFLPITVYKIVFSANPTRSYPPRKC